MTRYRSRSRSFMTLLAAFGLCLGTGALVLPGPTAGLKTRTVEAAPPTSPTDESTVPHYFGPYPNWANSPQVLADAVVTVDLGTAAAVPYGNPLIDRQYATDAVALPGTLGPVFVVLPNTLLPGGTLESFQTWNQAGSAPSAGHLFHAYVLHPTGTANQYQIVFDSGELIVPPLVNPLGEVATFPIVGGVTVQAGDMLGFYGQGIPLDLGVTVNPDSVSYPAPAAPKQGGMLTMGVDPGFPIYSPIDRTYSFSASVAPVTRAEATATVDPKTGGVTAITVTNPGSGYTAIPGVTIDAPGVVITTPASATAAIATGVVSSIAVDQAGFGFTAPQVAISGAAATPASAQASGGVDNVTVTSGGVYNVEPIVVFSQPDLPAAQGGVQATGMATMVPIIPATNPPTYTVTDVAVVDAGAGYTKAPTIDIFDGTPTAVAPTPAVTVPTINISKVAIIAGGSGYLSAPLVTILDGGITDRGALATATIAAAGAVTSITVVNRGAGYLTPGLKKFVDTLPGLGRRRRTTSTTTSPSPCRHHDLSRQ